MKNVFFLGQVLPFFNLVTEPGRSEPGALSFFCLVSEPGQSGPGAFFFLGILGQIRGVPAEDEKHVGLPYVLSRHPDHPPTNGNLKDVFNLAV